MSNLLAAIRAREAAISDVRIVVKGTIETAPDRFTALALSIAATHQDAALMAKLVTIAERSCIVTNTLRSGVSIALTIE